MKKQIIILLLILISIIVFLPNNQVEPLEINHDQDEDGILDLADIVAGARLEVKQKTKYKDAYYQGGYPPEGEGVCTDLIWRAFAHAGYDLKEMVDQDIREHQNEYPSVTVTPDPNIDFRRVKNLKIFFARKGTVLTNQLIPTDAENLKQWQGGDIVITDDPEHIGILSDKRNRFGVPYVIHNAGPVPRESNTLQYWKITGHFRYPKEETP